MKKLDRHIIISLLGLLCATYATSQEVVKIVTQRRNEFSIANMLQPGFKAEKILLRDTVNRSDFEVSIKLEEYVKD